MNDFLKFIKTIYNFNNDLDKVFELEGLNNTHESLLREFQKIENDKLAENINDDLLNENLTIDDLLILYGTNYFEEYNINTINYTSRASGKNPFLYLPNIPLKEDTFKYQNFKGEVKTIWSGIK